MQIHVCHARVWHWVVCGHWLCLLPVTPARRDGHVLGPHWPAPQRSSQLLLTSCAKHGVYPLVSAMLVSCNQPKPSIVYVTAVTLHVVCLAGPFTYTRIVLTACCRSLCKEAPRQQIDFAHTQIPTNSSPKPAFGTRTYLSCFATCRH